MTSKALRVDLIGVPLDLGAGRRGVDMGPSAVRLTGLSARIAELGHVVNDLGDVPVPIPEITPVGGSTKRYVAEIAEVCRTIAAMTTAAVEEGRIPVCIGGDPALTYAATAPLPLATLVSAAAVASRRCCNSRRSASSR